jgi:hypothetical protein
VLNVSLTVNVMEIVSKRCKNELGIRKVGIPRLDESWLARNHVGVFTLGSIH